MGIEPSAWPGVIAAGPSAATIKACNGVPTSASWKPSTPRPDEPRRKRAVGSTWAGARRLAQATIASGVCGPRNIAPALRIFAASTSGSAVMISRCSAASASAQGRTDLLIARTLMIAPKSRHEARATAARQIRRQLRFDRAGDVAGDGSASSVIRIDGGVGGRARLAP